MSDKFEGLKEVFKIGREVASELGLPVKGVQQVAKGQPGNFSEDVRSNVVAALAAKGCPGFGAPGAHA